MSNIIIPLRAPKKVTRDVRFGMRSVDFEVYLAQNDTGPRLQFNLLDPDGSPVNLNGKTVNFYLRRYGSLSAVEQQDPMCEIIESTSGFVVYSFGAGELAEPGTYYGDVEIVGEKVQKAPSQLRLIVREKNN